MRTSGRADKLLQFRLDAGDAGGHRQNPFWYRRMVSRSSIFVGKKVVIVANLKPRKMRGQNQPRNDSFG